MENKIKDFVVNQVVDCTLAVVEANVKEASNGSYLHMVLTDGVENIDAKLWKYPKNGNVPPGNMVVDVNAQVGSYKGKKDLNVKSIKHNQTIPFENFLGYDRELAISNFQWLMDQTKRCESELGNITSHIYKKYLDRVLKAVGAKSVHHNNLGGYLQHTVEVVEAADRLSSVAEGIMSCNINKEMITCGSILHDIGKLDAYSVDGLKIDESTPGMLIDHMAISILMIDQAYNELKLEKGNEYYQLLHIIQSHHGCKEWGSPVEPKTIEAQIVHFADNFSAKVEIMKNELDKCDTEWTEKCWSLGGIRLYKGV